MGVRNELKTLEVRMVIVNLRATQTKNNGGRQHNGVPKLKFSLSRRTGGFCLHVFELPKLPGSSVSQITFLNWCLPLLEVSLKLHRATFHGTLHATFQNPYTHAHMAQIVTPVQSSPLEVKDCLSCSSRHTYATNSKHLPTIRSSCSTPLAHITSAQKST